MLNGTEVVLGSVNNWLAATTTCSHSSIHLRHHSVICSWAGAVDLCMWSFVLRRVRANGQVVRVKLIMKVYLVG